MKRIKIGDAFEASQIAMGCMRICRIPENDAERLVYTVLDQGIDYFDHADVYGFGKSEEYFGRIMEPEEIEAAFDELHAAGKVRHFGVSNHNKMELEYLQESNRFWELRIRIG